MIPVSMGDMVHWIADRFSGVATPPVVNPDPYQPTGQTGIEVSSCTE